MIGVGFGAGGTRGRPRVLIAAAAAVATVTVAPSSFSVEEDATQQLTATVKDALGNTLTGRTVTWASSNESFATVDASGLVTGVAAGSATITATCETVDGTSTATVTAVGGTDPVFYDGFETGDFTAATYARANNANGDLPVVSSANPQTGTYACRFVFDGVAGGADCSSELRCLLPAEDAADEQWWQWKLYIPANYAHRAQASGGNNNKFFILGYAITGGAMHANDDGTTWIEEVGGWTCRIESEYPISTGIARSRFAYGNENSTASSENAGGIGPWCGYVDGLIVAADLGTWVTYGVHLRLSTTIAAADGLFELYKNGSLFVRYEDLPLGGVSSNLPIRGIELMGWANTGFDEQTIVDLDDITVYNTDPGWGA